MSCMKKMSDIFEILYNSIGKIFSSIGQFILNIHWLGIAQFLGGLGTIIIAGIAWRGLNAWRTELGHKEKLKTLTDLMEGMTQLFYRLKEPIKTIKFMEELSESMQGFEPEPDYGENTGFIRFIESQGQNTSKSLYDRLQVISDAISKVQPLILNAECMGFQNLKNSRTVYLNFIICENKIAAFRHMLSLQNMNWENPRVQDSVTSVRQNRSQLLDDQLNNDFNLFIEFSKENMNLLIH